MMATANEKMLMLELLEKKTMMTIGKVTPAIMLLSDTYRQVKKHTKNTPAQTDAAGG